MKKYYFSCILSFLVLTASAQGGMWLTSQLKGQEKEMQSLGLKISADKIYSSSDSSLNNAVVLFGRGCTAEMVSPNGLLFTNHHCGYGTVQRLSTVDKNYLEKGFWAKNMGEELPCPGLTVSFIRSMEDVTHQVLANINDDMDEDTRSNLIQQNIKSIEKGFSRITGLDAEVKSFYNGNKYMVVLKEVYKDVRLVAFPPNGIGRFGNETDNWMWPQEKGDFSVFRVYANKKNQPANYSKDNVPYHPKQYFKISTKGYNEGDLAMVYGFPYATQEYITSTELSQLTYTTFPIRIEAWRLRLQAWDSAMHNNPSINLQYTSKYAGISNVYKKTLGIINGLTASNALDIKKDYENKFQIAANNNSKDTNSKMLLSKMNALIEGNKDIVRQNEYEKNTVWAIETIKEASVIQKIIGLYRSTQDASIITDSLATLKKEFASFQNGYSPVADQAVFEALMPLYFSQDRQYIPNELFKTWSSYNGSFESWANDLFFNSVISNKGLMNIYFDEPNAKDTVALKNDPAYIIYSIVSNWHQKNIAPQLNTYEKALAKYNRQYVKYQLAYNVNGKNMYPDANQTLRLSYGIVKGITPIGTTTYSYQTNIDQEMARYDSTSDEFNIPKELVDIYRHRDYGRWQSNGTIPVNFITINHTSGGNSGSPMLNAKGELIGLNFDRIWDGTMSDYYFTPQYCRNVAVDIRYVLFLIEKYGKASWLLKEMSLVK